MVKRPQRTSLNRRCDGSHLLLPNLQRFYLTAEKAITAITDPHSADLHLSPFRSASFFTAAPRGAVSFHGSQMGPMGVVFPRAPFGNREAGVSRDSHLGILAEARSLTILPEFASLPGPGTGCDHRLAAVPPFGPRHRISPCGSPHRRGKGFRTMRRLCRA